MQQTTTVELIDDEQAERVPTELEREVYALSESAVMMQLRETWPQLVGIQNRFSLLVFRVWENNWFRDHGSLAAWARAEFGVQSSGTIAKHREGGEFLMRRVTDRADREAILERSSLLQLAEAGVHRVARTNPEKAIELAKSGKTTRELREIVRAEEATVQHLDTGGFRTLHFASVSTEAYEAFMRMYRRARFFCMTPKPADSELLQLMAAELETSMQIQPETARRVGRAVASWRGRVPGLEADPDDDAIMRAGIAAIDAGWIACIETGATNGNDMDFHHSHPKSAPGGVGSPQVPLSRAAHAAVKEDFEGGGWRGHVRRWMATPKLDWFKVAFERYLNGRSLEQL